MLISTSVWYLRKETVTDGWKRDLSKPTSNCDDLHSLPIYWGQCVLYRGSYKPSQVYALCHLAVRLGPHGFKWEQKIKSTETWTVINIDNSVPHLNAGRKLHLAMRSSDDHNTINRREWASVCLCLLCELQQLVWPALVSIWERYTWWISLIWYNLAVLFFFSHPVKQLFKQMMLL